MTPEEKPGANQEKPLQICRTGGKSPKSISCLWTKSKRKIPGHMPYVAPLDGIRAIAIFAVLLFHMAPEALRGGFTGVDVFYVLSGFLITSIIFNDIREGTFSLREFYLRRVQRLLPNIVVTVLAVLLLWKFFLPPSTARQIGNQSIWTLFNLSNIYIWRNLGGYWGDAAEWSPLTHAWSLGIEEQFYLLFPSCLLVLARFQSTKVRSWLSAAAVLSFATCLYGSYTHPQPTFYLLPTRVWELLFGAVLASHRTPLRPKPGDQPGVLLGAKAREMMGWAGLGMIIAGFFTINGFSIFPGWVSLAPTLGTVFLLVSVADGDTKLSRALSLPFMVQTGKLSYSIYLWHWPLITIGKIEADLYGFPRLAGAIAGGLAGILLATLAYVYVERPMRNRGVGRYWRFVKIAAGFSLVSAFALFVAIRHPVADPEHRYDKPAFYGKLFDAGRPAETDPAKFARYYDMYFPPLPDHLNDSWRTGGILRLYGGDRPKVVVFGSSHALMYSRLINDICHELGLSVAFLGTDAGTPAFFETKINPNFSSSLEAREFDGARRKWLQEWHPEAVIVIDRWDVNSLPQDFDVRLRSFLNEVSPLAGRVIFVAQVPMVKGTEGINLRELITWHRDKLKGPPHLDVDSGEPARKQAVAAAEAARSDYPNLRVLRADLPFYEIDGSIRYASGRTFFYADDNHLTDGGTEVVRGLFQSAIVEATAGSSHP